MDPLSQRNFTKGLIPFVLSVGLIFCKNFISMSPVIMMNARAWLPLLGRIACLPLSLFFSGLQTKIPPPPLFQLKGNKAFSQAERLFPSDNSLSQLKWQQKTWRFTRLWWIFAALTLRGSQIKTSLGGIRLQVNQHKWMEKISPPGRAKNTATRVTDSTRQCWRHSTLPSEWHVLEWGSRQPVCCFQKKGQGFSFKLSHKPWRISWHVRVHLCASTRATFTVGTLKVFCSQAQEEALSCKSPAQSITGQGIRAGADVGA